MNVMTTAVGSAGSPEMAATSDTVFTLLRTQLLLKLLPEGMRLIGIASPNRGEGRTRVTSLLGQAIAQVHSCVLVDLHLKRPDLSHKFGMENEPGVLDRLTTGVSVLDRLDLKLNSNAPHVLPIGRSLASASELLFSDRLGELFLNLKQLSGEPWILVDLPPVREGDDYLVIAQHLDGQIMVVEEDVTSAHDLGEALRLSAHVPLIGTILNKTDDLI